MRSHSKVPVGHELLEDTIQPTTKSEGILALGAYPFFPFIMSSYAVIWVHQILMKFVKNKKELLACKREASITSP